MAEGGGHNSIDTGQEYQPNRTEQKLRSTIIRHEMLKSVFVFSFRTLITVVLNVGSMDGLYYKQNMCVYIRC